jgi:hypothetical protein
METSEQPPRTPRANPRPHKATAGRDRDDCAIHRHEKILAHPIGATYEEELGCQEAHGTGTTNRPIPT